MGLPQVTTRFGSLIPVGLGITHFSVGLLAEPQAVALLLETAQINNPTPAQSSTAVIIARLCGGLPLFITIAARMIHGYLEGGSHGSWEVEVRVASASRLCKL